MAVTTLARRQRAALPGGSIDRWLRPVKRLLPWAAAATLAATLALALSKGGEFSFILKRGEFTTAAERLRAERATYRGLDDRGRAFTLTADEAVQRSAALPVVELRALTAELALAGGPARLTAAAGEYDLERDRVLLAAPVRAAQGGFALDTGRATLDLKSKRLASEGPVTGRSRLGRFTAGRMTADLAGDHVVLSGGARLHIDRRARR